MDKKRIYLLLTALFSMFLLLSCAVTENRDSELQYAEKTQDDLVLQFIGKNFDQLRSEMAVGEGKVLTRLATLLAIKEENKQRFYALSRNNFNQLFVSSETTSTELLANLHREMRLAKIF